MTPEQLSTAHGPSCPNYAQLTAPAWLLDAPRPVASCVSKQCVHIHTPSLVYGTYWHANKQHRLGTCFQWHPSNICRLFVVEVAVSRRCERDQKQAPC